MVCDWATEGPSDLEVFAKPFVELVPKTEKENGTEVSSGSDCARSVVCIGPSSAVRSPTSSSIIWTSSALSSIFCSGEGEREYPEVSPPLAPGALPSEGCGGL